MTLKRMKPWLQSLALFSALSLSTQVYSAGLLHSLVHSSNQLEELLLGKGFTTHQISSLLASRSEVLQALGGETKGLSGGELYRNLAMLKVEGNRDRKIQSSLLKLLSKEDSKVSQKEMSLVFNQMIYLSHRYGRSASAVLVCGQCIDREVARGGIRFALEEIVDPNNKKVLTQIPNRPSDLKRYISNQMKKSALGDYSKVPRSLVSADEERSLALFLAMKNSSQESSRKLFNQIIKLSTDAKTSKVTLFNSQDPHKLWKIFSDDPNDAEVRSWTKLLEQVESSRAQGEGLESAFYSVLERKARGDDTLTRNLEKLKEKNCYFK